MCEKCDFFNNMVEKAQEVGVTPQDFMHGCISFVINGNAGFLEIPQDEVTVAVYRNDGTLLNVAGTNPKLTPEAQYKLDQMMQKHNSGEVEPVFEESFVNPVAKKDLH